MDNNKEPNFKLILLSALTEPDYSILEFWQKKQKETGYSEEVFYRKLNDILKHYSNIIESKIQKKESVGVSVSDYKIPLLIETDFQVNGELGKNEINYLGSQLKKYYNSIFLSIEKLKECEFSAEQIERLLAWDEYETIVKNDKGTFYASNIERKIYSGIEAHKKIYFKDKQNPKFPFDCLDLLPDYYLLTETAFIEKQRNIAGTIFNEDAAKENFRLKEIDKISEIINGKKELNNNLPLEQKFIESEYSKFEIYLQWLKDGTATAKPRKKRNIITSPVIKLFCAIIHQCKLLERGEESAEEFIKKVTNKYSIEVNLSKARQYFNAEIDITKSDQRKYLDKIKKYILPNIEPDAKQRIETFLQEAAAEVLTRNNEAKQRTETFLQNKKLYT